MSKNLKTVTTDLAALAAPLPTQHVVDRAPKEPPKAATAIKTPRQKPKAAWEREVQFSLAFLRVRGVSSRSNRRKPT